MPSDQSDWAAERLRMVDSQLQARGIADQRVLDAMARVPRHLFAPDRYRDQAYEDHPLPIGQEQTISQPYIVAIMLEALRLGPSDSVLEVGTGSGYLTALLAELTHQVISIERHGILADMAKNVLSQLGYTNVRIIKGDGSRGIPEFAPYDAIIVSAAAAILPSELTEQLAEGGRMIIPIGTDDAQQLQFIEKRDGALHIRAGALCRFVPLVVDSR